MKHQRICFAFLFLSVNLVSAVATQTFELTNILSFDGTNGAEPWCKLIRGRDGLLYGTTYSGGNNAGTIFKMTPFGKLTTMYAFGFSTGGYYPGAGLVEASDGNFYGTTTDGGMNSSISPYGTSGLIYRITPTGEFTNLYQFSGPDGANPWAGPLVQGRDGFLYGTTSDGGSGELPGSIFQISTNGFFNSLCGLYGDDGLRPYGGLVEGFDGNFYGTMSSGIRGAWGAVFKVTSNGAYTALFSFSGQNGAIPFGGLVQGKDGNFYGTTSQGGPSYGDQNSINGQGYGTIFKITTNGELTTLYSFQGTNGAYPYGPLMQATDGRLYGTTLAGGAYTNFFPELGSAGYGTLFRITTNGEFTTLYSFDKTNGSSPFGTPLQVGDGGFFGTTEFGGAYNLGTVYHFRVPLPPALRVPTVITNECGFPDLLTVTITNFDAGVLTSVWSVNQQPAQTNTFQGQSGSEILGLYQLASLPGGTNVVTYSVTDEAGETVSTSTTVITIDTTSPVIASAQAVPSVLWPPNGKLVNVQILALLQDSCRNATYKIISVESPGVSSGKKGRFTYWQITGDHTVALRAERGLGGRDRVYRITLVATDFSGNVSQPRVVTVLVPKNQPGARQLKP